MDSTVTPHVISPFAARVNRIPRIQLVFPLKMAEETKESQFHAMATANKVSTGPTGFGGAQPLFFSMSVLSVDSFFREFFSVGRVGTWSVSQKAYQALLESASVAEWVAEAMKPDATPVLRGFTASAIIEIEKKKPSEANATAVVPFLAAATAWKGSCTFKSRPDLARYDFCPNFPTLRLKYTFLNMNFPSKMGFELIFF
jgi:hypothetical protein